MPRFRFRPTLFALLIAWLSVIVFSMSMLMSAEISRWQGHFDDDVSVLVGDVKHKLDTNEAVLAGFSAFLQAVDRSDTDSTMKYAAAAAATYPHIYMLEVARKVALSQQAPLQASLRKKWRADFSIKDFPEITGRPFSGDVEKSATWPILFMYPSLPEAQKIYGVRLETVDYLSHSMALAQKNIKPVVSAVFNMYEGGGAYILLQEVIRTSRSSASLSEPDFFGDTMMALLVIRTQALIPAINDHDDHEKIHFAATLASAANPESLLFERQAVPAGRLDQLFLPKFSRRENINNASQPTLMVFDRQLLWSDVLSREALMLMALLGVALLFVPWLTLRHYIALDRSAIEYERSAYLATHDLLTDLPNRILFKDRFEQVFQNWQRNGASFALMLVDLDHFKDINDQHGHEIGDQVLLTSAKRMAHQLRACDTVARHGGDEFVVLLANILSPDDAAHVGEKLRAAIVEAIETNDGPLKVSCSIGIAVCPVHGDSLDVLRKSADRAMYRAKAQGRNSVSVFSSETS